MIKIFCDSCDKDWDHALDGYTTKNLFQNGILNIIPPNGWIFRVTTDFIRNVSGNVEVSSYNVLCPDCLEEETHSIDILNNMLNNQEEED